MYTHSPRWLLARGGCRSNVTQTAPPRTVAPVSKIQRGWEVEVSPREFQEETSSGCALKSSRVSTDQEARDWSKCRRSDWRR